MAGAEVTGASDPLTFSLTISQIKAKENMSKIGVTLPGSHMFGLRLFSEIGIHLQAYQVSLQQPYNALQQRFRDATYLARLHCIKPNELSSDNIEDPRLLDICDSIQLYTTYRKEILGEYGSRIAVDESYSALHDLEPPPTFNKNALLQSTCPSLSGRALLELSLARRAIELRLIRSSRSVPNLIALQTFLRLQSSIPYIATALIKINFLLDPLFKAYTAKEYYVKSPTALYTIEDVSAAYDEVLLPLKLISKRDSQDSPNERIYLGNKLLDLISEH